MVIVFFDSLYIYYLFLLYLSINSNDIDYVKMNLQNYLYGNTTGLYCFEMVHLPKSLLDLKAPAIMVCLIICFF